MKDIWKRIVTAFLLILLMAVLAGCESAKQIPKDDLKMTASSRIRSEYNNAECIFTGEKYDQEKQIYELTYTVKESSAHGFTMEERLVSVRFVYDSASKEWRGSKPECSNLKFVPNFEIIGQSFFAESSEGGDIGIQILSLNSEKSTVSVRIRENNLAVRAENDIRRPIYRVDRDEQELTCSYYAGNDEVVIYFGETNGIQQKMLLRYNPFFDEPQFTFYIGNNAFDGLNASLDLKKR